MEGRVAAIRKRENGKICYFMHRNGEWMWVPKEEVPDQNALRIDFQYGGTDFEMSNSLAFDRLIVKKRAQKNSKGVQEKNITLDHIYLKSTEQLYAIDPSSCTIKPCPSAETKRHSRRKIVEIEECIKRGPSVEWVVRLDNGDTQTLNHNELRARNLPLFLEYAKTHL